MHEVSIMQSTLQLAEEHALQAGGTRISCIRLRVGLVSGVVPEALEFAFEVLKEDSMAAQATLEIERVPGLFSCDACGLETLLDTIQFQCPGCGGALILRGGTELELAQLEVL